MKDRLPSLLTENVLCLAWGERELIGMQTPETELRGYEQFLKKDEG